MRLAIVGSVSFNSPGKTIHAQSIVYNFVDEWKDKIEVIISGGAIGIDTVAEHLADYFNIPKRIHYPQNNRWAPLGYKDRNLVVARDCTHLLCVRDKSSKTYGSGWTSDRALEMGKIVWRYDL